MQPMSTIDLLNREIRDYRAHLFWKIHRSRDEIRRNDEQGRVAQVNGGSGNR